MLLNHQTISKGNLFPEIISYFIFISETTVESAAKLKNGDPILSITKVCWESNEIINSVF